MDKKDLLFYDAYEAFYKMAKESQAFRAFCRDAFGEDLSQDGFGNMEQIEMLLPYIPENARILDIGCGNGKLLGYLQRKTHSRIYGFDYSEEAISTARRLYSDNSEFRVGIIGETDYPDGLFDVVISMDTMYFAPDMTAFTAQIKRWLKADGVFFAGYQEGDVIPKTENIRTALLTKAAEANGMAYEVRDITEKTFELLSKKRNAAIKHRREFEAEGNGEWFDLLMAQTECALVPYAEFREKMSRYIYVIRKRIVVSIIICRAVRYCCRVGACPHHCHASRDNPSAPFGGTSPFRGGCLSLEQS